MFGGIIEVTKEINDMYAYDFKQRKWKILYKELHPNDGKDRRSSSLPPKKDIANNESNT